MSDYADGLSKKTEPTPREPGEIKAMQTEFALTLSKNLHAFPSPFLGMLVLMEVSLVLDWVLGLVTNEVLLHLAAHKKGG